MPSVILSVFFCATKTYIAYTLQTSHAIKIVTIETVSCTRTCVYDAACVCIYCIIMKHGKPTVYE